MEKEAHNRIGNGIDQIKLYLSLIREPVCNYRYAGEFSERFGEISNKLYQSLLNNTTFTTDQLDKFNLYEEFCNDELESTSEEEEEDQIDCTIPSFSTSDDGAVVSILHPAAIRLPSHSHFKDHRKSPMQRTRNQFLALKDGIASLIYKFNSLKSSTEGVASVSQEGNNAQSRPQIIQHDAAYSNFQQCFSQPSNGNPLGGVAANQNIHPWFNQYIPSPEIDQGIPFGNHLLTPCLQHSEDEEDEQADEVNLNDQDDVFENFKSRNVVGQEQKLQQQLREQFISSTQKQYHERYGITLEIQILNRLLFDFLRLNSTAFYGTGPQVMPAQEVTNVMLPPGQLHPILFEDDLNAYDFSEQQQSKKRFEQFVRADLRRKVQEGSAHMNLLLPFTRFDLQDQNFYKHQNTFNSNKSSSLNVESVGGIRVPTYVEFLNFVLNCHPANLPPKEDLDLDSMTSIENSSFGAIQPSTTTSTKTNSSSTTSTLPTTTTSQTAQPSTSSQPAFYPQRGYLVCKNCNRRFRDTGYLARHLRVHKGDKGARCRYCDNDIRKMKKKPIFGKLDTSMNLVSFHYGDPQDRFLHELYGTCQDCGNVLFTLKHTDNK